jgi:hypothetical protein
MSRNPEEMAENKARIRKEIQAVVSDRANTMLTNTPLIDDLVEVVVAECTELRERIAERIIDPLIGRYEDGLDNDRLEILKHVILSHYEDSIGSIELLDPPKRGGLQSI